jgi:hypothetical protein
MSNTDVSRLLGEMWRNASVADRAPYVKQEELERADYKQRIKTWRDTQARLDAASRTSHRKVQKMVDYAPPVHHAHSFGDPSMSFERMSFEPVRLQSVEHATHKFERMSFEPVRVQSVEHATHKANQRMFRSYNGPYQQPHQPHHHPTYLPAKDSFDYGAPLVPDSSIQLRHDYAEPEPFQPAHRQRPPPSQGEEDANRFHPAHRQRPPPSQGEEDVNRYNGRSPYFQDSAHPFNFYQFP